MAKSKIPVVKDLSGYLFMGIEGTKTQVVYHDNTDKGLAIGAAFASLLEEDNELFDIFSSAMLVVLETKAKKEKYSSKKSNIVPKTAKKVGKKK